MKITWVIDQDAIARPNTNLAKMKDLGSTWGSWATWKEWKTDNIVAYDYAKTADLVRRKYQDYSNLYIQENYYNQLNRPTNVKLYNGSFDTDFSNQEQVMAMILTAATADVVILLEFNLNPEMPTDPYQRHLKKNYQTAVTRALMTFPNTQWVFVDPIGEINNTITELPNVSCDTMENVLQLIA